MENSMSCPARNGTNPLLRVAIPPPHLGEQLYFHEKCGKNAVVINNGETAHRKEPYETPYHGLVFSHRFLFDNELFEVTVDEIISKWPGYTFGIGVTAQHPAMKDEDEDNLEWLHDTLSCSWYSYGNSIYENGENIIEEYGIDLGNIKEGDQVGVMRKDNGTLHFFVNGMDKGPSATDVPTDVFGVIDLGGCCVRASVVDPLTPVSR
ncbi:neuralized-like protein 4 [Ischnura elegans]|uniref:neuralized-like protein 4 n=1 Tax=Ischnura elegans TaxID=197161 RepID=UPI001ED8665A|nr:neuralized-like protein 4 [Ischnura elegans]